MYGMELHRQARRWMTLLLSLPCTHVSLFEDLAEEGEVRDLQINMCVGERFSMENLVCLVVPFIAR